MFDCLEHMNEILRLEQFTRAQQPCMFNQSRNKKGGLSLRRYELRTTFRVPNALRTWISDCDTWQKTSNIWIIFRFMSAAASPRLAITFRSADDSGSSKPSRMNSRQKSFFVEVGLCSSKTDPIPFNACTMSSLCSAKSSSRRSTRTFNPRHLIEFLGKKGKTFKSLYRSRNIRDARDEHLQSQHGRVT